MNVTNELKPTSSFRMVWVTLSMVAGVALFFAFAVLPYLRESSVAAAGQTAPEIQLRTLDGSRMLSLRELSGKVVVLDFWASWCTPCEAQARVLERVLERRRGQPFAVLGVVTGDQLDDARRAADQHRYPSVFDADGTVAAAYGIGSGGPAATSGGLPTVVVIDREQKVTAVRQGAIDEPTLERLIGEASR